MNEQRAKTGLSRRTVLQTGAAAGALLGPGAAAQVGKTPVKIGVLTDVSGVYADISGNGSVLAARMAAAEFGNQVLGHPIEIIQADHQNKADIGSAIATRWLDAEGVDVIADLPNSAVMLAVQDIARSRKRIALVSTGGSSDFTNGACSPYGFHWTYDTYALSKVLGRQITPPQGPNTWFLVVVDYTFGTTAAKELKRFVEEAGGRVVGTIKHPIGTTDYSSYLLQAQSSKAGVVALLNAGSDTINAIKGAQEFGLTAGGQSLVGLLMFIDDVHSLGLATAQGLIITEAFYWDRTDETREWSKRFFATQNAMPSSAQAGVYSAVRHYLKAVEAAGSKDADAVAAKMRDTPVNDMFSHGGLVRADGRMVHDMYLFKVKLPAESKYPWDYYKVLHTVPGEEAFRPLSESTCSLATASK